MRRSAEASGIGIVEWAKASRYLACKEVYMVLESRGLLDSLSFIKAIHEIIFQCAPPVENIIDGIVVRDTICRSNL
jgi:hypothetical protein